MAEIVAALPKIAGRRREAACRTSCQRWRSSRCITARLPENVQKQILAGNRPKVDITGAPFGNSKPPLDLIDQRSIASMRRDSANHVFVASRSLVTVSASPPSR